MSKVIFVSSVAGFIESFEIENIKILQNLGHEVYVATNLFDDSSKNYFKTPKLDDLNVHKINLPFTRTPVSYGNVKGFLSLLKILRNNDFLLVDCHTPTGGVVGRLAAKFAKIRHINYTAHGFHFFKGSGLKSWLIFYPIEFLLSYFSTTIITINNEDFSLAKKRFTHPNIVKIPGVGLDTAVFRNFNIDVRKERDKLNISNDSIVILSVGELSPRKNHEIIIRALGALNNKKIIYLIVGEGPLFDFYNHLIVSLNLSSNVFILGRREDIPRLCKLSDIFIHPSIREGLGISALEGMASGLPLIASDINGIKDYAQTNITGINISPKDQKGFEKAIRQLAESPSLRNEYGENNINVANEFDKSKTNIIMREMYSSLNNGN